MRTKILLTLLIVPMFTGCSPSYVFNPAPNSIAAKIVIERDDFKKLTTFTGPDCISTLPSSGAGGPYFPSLCLYGGKEDKTGLMFYAITIKISYYADDWRFYDSAYDNDGNKLYVRALSRKVLWCSSECAFEEGIGIFISKKYMKDHKDSGISFKLYGKGDEATFFVPPTYVQTFLSVTTQGQDKEEEGDGLEQRLLDIYFRK